MNVCLASVCLSGRIWSETCSHYNMVARLCGSGKLLPTSNFFGWLVLPLKKKKKGPKSCDCQVDEIHPGPRPLPYLQIDVEHEESWVRMVDKHNQQSRSVEHLHVLLTFRIQLVRKTQQRKGLHRMGTYDHFTLDQKRKYGLIWQSGWGGLEIHKPRLKSQYITRRIFRHCPPRTHWLRSPLSQDNSVGAEVTGLHVSLRPRWVLDLPDKSNKG